MTAKKQAALCQLDTGKGQPPTSISTNDSTSVEKRQPTTANLNQSLTAYKAASLVEGNCSAGVYSLTNPSVKINGTNAHIHVWIDPLFVQEVAP